MNHGRYIIAGQAYRCRYVCTGCGQRSTERGRFLRADRLWPGSIASSWQEEVELSGELAQERALRRFYRLRANVHDRRWYAGLRVSGRCRRCGRMQPWSPALRHGVAAMAVTLCLTVWLTLAGWPASSGRWAVLAGACVASAWAAEGFMLVLARFRMGRQPEECLPALTAAQR